MKAPSDSMKSSFTKTSEDIISKPQQVRPSSTFSSPPPQPSVSQEELNELAAEVLRAKLMGNMELHDQLQNKLQKLRDLQKAVPPQEEKTVQVIHHPSASVGKRFNLKDESIESMKYREKFSSEFDSERDITTRIGGKKGWAVCTLSISSGKGRENDNFFL
jgi:hypothetical protein